MPAPIERWPWAAALVAGLAWGLTFSSESFGWLGVMGLLALPHSIVGSSTDVLRGLLIGVLAAGLGLAWVPATLDAVDEPGTLLFLGAVLLEATVPAAAAALASQAIQQGWTKPVAVGSAWTLADFGSGFLPFPFSPAIFVAETWEIAWPVAIAGRAAGSGVLVGLAAIPLGWAFGALGATWFVGFLGSFSPTPPHDTARFVILQPNLPAQPPDEAQWANDIARLVEESGPGILITPELAWPYPRLNTSDVMRRSFPDRATLVGHRVHGETRATWSLTGAWVAKERRVPVVEKRWFGWGEDRVVPGAPGLLDLGAKASIRHCYEDMTPQSDGVLTVSMGSDVRLGDIGSRQHLAGARIATIASRRWTVRAMNNGPSGFIDPWGRVHHPTAFVAPGTPASSVTMEVPLLDGKPTPEPVIPCLVAMGLLLSVVARPW